MQDEKPKKVIVISPTAGGDTVRLMVDRLIEACDGSEELKVAWRNVEPKTPSEMKEILDRGFDEPLRGPVLSGNSFAEAHYDEFPFHNKNSTYVPPKKKGKRGYDHSRFSKIKKGRKR